MIMFINKHQTAILVKLYIFYQVMYIYVLIHSLGIVVL